VVVVGDLNETAWLTWRCCIARLERVHPVRRRQDGLGAPTPSGGGWAVTTRSLAAVGRAGRLWYVGPTVAALTLNPATIAGAAAPPRWPP